jgi:hypothetical protein
MRSLLYINVQLYKLYKSTLKYEGWRRIIKNYTDYDKFLRIFFRMLWKWVGGIDQVDDY